MNIMLGIMLLVQIILLHQFYKHDIITSSLVERTQSIISTKNDKLPPSEPFIRSSKYEQCEGTIVSWTVPNNIENITIQILNKSGNIESEYNITRWITITPGQTIKLIAE